MRYTTLVGITVLVLVFFAAWELIERRWAAGTESPTLHILHLARGIGASLAAAGLLAWIIRRSSPAPLPATVAPYDPQSSNRWAFREPDGEQWSWNYMRWFIVMRWIAVVVSAALVFFATHVANLLAHDLWVPLCAAIGVLAACNGCYELLIRRRDRPGSSTEWPAILLPVQIAVDLLILTALLHYSGGIENPLSLLMVFHVIIAGIVLSRRQCFATAAFASALFAMLAAGEWSGVLEHHTLFTFPHFHHEGLPHAAHFAPYVFSSVAVQTVVLLLAAYFVTTLSERVLYDERELASMAERAMAERQLLERAMDTTGTGLRVLDRDLRPYWLNQQWTRLMQRMDQPPSGANAASPTSRTLADGQVRLTEIGAEPFATSHSAGDAVSCRILQLTTAPLFDKTGQISQVVELAQDISRQREAQARLIRASRLAAVGELAGHVAHEVNNPIAIISAKALLLLDDHAGEMSAHVAGELEKIAHCAQRVAAVAQRLLGYCRFSAQPGAAVNVRLPMDRAIGLIEQRLSHIQFQDRVDRALPTVLANPDQLEQVFCNLMLNAIEAMPDGGRLSISSHCAAGHVEIRFEDTGCGMSPDVQQRIFEPFFTTKAQAGTGLGLAICQEIIQSSGGQIEVSSLPGRGSSFTVRLPISEMTGDSAAAPVRAAASTCSDDANGRSAAGGATLAQDRRN